MSLAKVEVSLTSYAEETVRVLGQCGCLLVSGKMEKANVMAIGWGFIGPLWGKPFFMVAVRPSRYTYEFLEETGDFTVNVPKGGMEQIVDYCGSVSGRKHNKFQEKGLTLAPAKKVSSPVISECTVHYECKVAYKMNVVPKGLPEEVIKSYYPSGNFHTFYFGEILATYADEDAKKHLPH